MSPTRRGLLQGGLAATLSGTAWGQAGTPDLGALEARARKETGLLVYGTLRPANWQPVQAALAAKYPWLKIEPLRIDLNNQIFDRYAAEAASGTRTADVLVVSALDRWQEFVTAGHAVDFRPPALAGLPAFANPLPGLFALSIEPMVMLTNKATLPQPLWATGFGDLADKVQANPAVFRNKVASYDPTVSTFGMSVFWGLATHHGEAFWPMLKKLAPALRFESTTGAMLDKVTTGEYAIALFVTEALLPPIDGVRSRIVRVSTYADGEPLFPRGMAVTKAAASPASAELLVEFLLSAEGQTALGKGGLAPYSPAVPGSAGTRTYGSVVKEVGGDEHVVVLGYDPGLLTAGKAFVERLRATLKPA